MALERPLDAYSSVKTWRAGLRAQWGGDPLAEDPGKLETLASFCAFTGQDPDALVAFCFLRKRDSGERFASVVRRSELAAKLRDCVAERALAGTPARRFSADVLSFLIHNGVMMSAAVARAAPTGQAA
jgi:hypothetical protein